MPTNLNPTHWSEMAAAVQSVCAPAYTGLIHSTSAIMPPVWHCTICRSAPLPLKVDGFSMGAVMGFSEQHTLLLLSSAEELAPFLNVRALHLVCVCVWQFELHY